MRRLRVTLDIETDLGAEQIRPLLSQVGYPAAKVTFIDIETTFTDRLTTLSDMIQTQRKWIEEHGGTLEGYIQRYGSVNEPEYSGAGGEAIFEADMTSLRNMEAAYNAILTAGDVVVEEGR